MRIFLIRHGETDWNKKGIFRGTADVPLNKKGKEQARAVGLRLAKLPLQAIYSSKLSRALETARAMAKDLSHFRKFEVFPASISLVAFEYGKWVLYRLNDVCHLSEARRSK